jgi:hypothetical protein
VFNLSLNARPDERFHLQCGEPQPHGWGWDGVCRRVWWTQIYTEHAEDAQFVSWVVLWVFRWYHGTVKCDGTRTYAFWNWLLGGPVDVNRFVMTTTPKELRSFRLSLKKPDRERWDNMGGI